MLWISAFCLGLCLTPPQTGFPVNTIRGIVVDRETQLPLEGVAVGILDSPTGTITEADGKFQLTNLSPGRYTLLLSMLGYQSQRIPALELSSGKELVLTIQMDPTTLQLQEVTITAPPGTSPRNEMAMTSARQFSLQEANRYAAGYGDPARMAVSFAGVTGSGNDDNNDIVIRGNSPKGLLWRLEGIEIPNPNHFSDGQGATSGIISMISTNSLANSDFFTGAFPAEYGNAASGVFDLRFRRGNEQQHEYTTQLSVIGLEAAAEGPLGKDASYRINARYSTLELLFKTRLVNIDPGSFNPAYRDANFTIQVPTKKAGTYTFWGLTGVSLADDEDASSRETGRQGLGVWGISHKITAGTSGYFYTVAAFSRESNSYYRDNLIDTLGWIHTRDQVYAYQNIRFSSYYNQRINQRLVVRTGIVTGNLGYDLQEDRWDNSRRTLVNYLRENDETWLLQAYTQLKYQAGNQLTATAGFHYSNFLLNGAQRLEPRIGLRYQVTPNASWNLGIGVHSRLEPISLYLYKRRVKGDIFTQPNLDLQPLRAVHYVLGYSRNIGRQTRLNLEGYYQKLCKVPIDSSQKSTYSILNSTDGIPTNILINTGQGENIGLECTLERSFADRYYFLITGSLFNSIFLAGDQKWRNTVFNNTFAANVLFGKEFALGKQKQHFLVLNIRWITRGGNRYTPIDLSASVKQNTTVLQSSKLFEPRLPTYRRIDFGISYKINRAGATWHFSADIQNIFNRKNPIQERYNSTTKARYYTYALPLLPILGIKVDF